MSETDDAIRDNIEGPRRYSGDTGSAEQHSPADQAEGDRYLASKDAMAKPHFGLRITKLVPPGAAE